MALFYIELFVLVAFAFLTWFAIRTMAAQHKGHEASIERLVNALSDAFVKSEDSNQRLVTHLAMLKGIEPHQADPDEFAPTGVSYKTLEKTKAAVSMDRQSAWRRRLMMIEQAADIFRARGEHERADSYKVEIAMLKSKLGESDSEVA